jgi:hypothetical protein
MVKVKIMFTGWRIKNAKFKMKNAKRGKGPGVGRSKRLMKTTPITPPRLTGLQEIPCRVELDKV